MNKRYPIGTQTFSVLRKENFRYVDKTKYVYQLAQDYRFVFLSRPRRFGKSLLVSTSSPKGSSISVGTVITLRQRQK